MISYTERFLHKNKAEVCVCVCNRQKSLAARSERVNVHSGAASPIHGKQIKEIHEPRPPALI